MVVYLNVDTGFLPEMDEGGYVLDVCTPAGTSLDETNQIIEHIEERIAKMPETDAFSRRTGARTRPLCYRAEQKRHSCKDEAYFDAGNAAPKR